MSDIEILLSCGEGITILFLIGVMALLACALVALIENSQYGKEDIFYESH